MAKRKARKAAKKVVRKTPTVKGAKKRHDLGILFVHGIGQQARGDTLVRFGKPLYQWFERWIGADEAGPILSFDEAKERLKKRFQKASTTNASSIDVVNASIRALPDDPAAPPQAEVQIRLPNRSGKIEKNSWLLVESWWAETFATPRFVDLARWGLLVVPWTLASHMGTHVRRLGKRIWSGSGLLGLLRGLVEGVFLVLYCLTIPFLALATMLLILLLLVLALPPVPRFRSFLLRVQHKLAATVGDSYVLLESPVQAAAIVGQVRRDLYWLAERCERVAVVAHSQGGAIAHEAFRKGLPKRLKKNQVLLFTLGSGLNKLEELRWLTTTMPWWMGWVAPAPLLFGLGSLLFFGFFGSAGGLHSSYLGFWFAFFAVYSFLFSLSVTIEGAGFKQQDFAPRKRFGLDLMWMDYYASADPVPNGPLFDLDRTPEYLRNQSVEVHNRAAPWSDHTSYWNNPDVFVSAVACAVSDLTGLKPDRVRPLDAERLQLAWYRRKWRVGWLKATRVVAGLLAFTLAAAFWVRDELGVIGRTVLPSVKHVTEALAGSQDGTLLINSTFLNPDVLGGASLVLAIFLGYQLMYWMWRWWQWKDVNAFFWRSDYRLHKVFWLFLFIGIVMLEVGLLLALGWTPINQTGDAVVMTGPRFISLLFFAGLFSFICYFLWFLARGTWSVWSTSGGGVGSILLGLLNVLFSAYLKSLVRGVAILLLTAPSMGWFLTYKTAWFLEKAQPVFSFVTPGLLLMGTVTAVGMILLEKYGPQMLTLLEQKGAVGPVTSALKVLGRGDGGKSSRGIRVRS